MDPAKYKECLSLLSWRDQLSPSSLRPTATTNVIAIERELKASFPRQYEKFLVEAGCGHEHGGLAIWHHLDLMLPGNILEASRIIWDEIQSSPQKNEVPEGILVISDRCDGTHLCLRRSGSSYLEPVWLWDSETWLFEKLANNLNKALSIICDCKEHEVEELQISHAKFRAALA